MEGGECLVTPRFPVDPPRWKLSLSYVRGLQPGWGMDQALLGMVPGLAMVIMASC